MSYTRTGAGPFARRLFIPEERIEKICRESLASSGLLPEKPEAIRIDRLIFLKFGFEEEYLELPAHIMGCAKFRKTGITRILVNRILAERGGPRNSDQLVSYKKRWLAGVKHHNLKDHQK